MTNEDDCPICSETLNDNTKTVVNLHSDEDKESQHHLFHLDCIHTWIQKLKTIQWDDGLRRRVGKSPNCPMCGNTNKIDTELVNAIEKVFQKEQEEKRQRQRRKEDIHDVSLRKKAIFHRRNQNGTWGRGGECCTPCKQSSWCDTITCKKPTCKKCNFDNYGNPTTSNVDVNCFPRS